MMFARIAGFSCFFSCLACGTPAQQLDQVWDDLAAMQLVALPTLQDYAQQGRWKPSVVCAGGGAMVNDSRLESNRQQALGTTVRAEQDSIHDITLRDCRPSSLTYSGGLQRELQLTRASDAAANSTVDWLHGSLHLRGAWEDTCYVNLRGIERGGQIVYRGRLCDEQVEHAVSLLER